MPRTRSRSLSLKREDHSNKMRDRSYKIKSNFKFHLSNHKKLNQATSEMCLRATYWDVIRTHHYSETWLATTSRNMNRNFKLNSRLPQMKHMRAVNSRWDLSMDHRRTSKIITQVGSSNNRLNSQVLSGSSQTQRCLIGTRQMLQQPQSTQILATQQSLEWNIKNYNKSKGTWQDKGVKLSTLWTVRSSQYLSIRNRIR